MVFMVQGAHGGRGGRNHVVHKEEQGILGTQVDSFTDQEIELAYGQVGWHQVLLLVQVSNACLGRLLHNHLRIEVSGKVKVAPVVVVRAEVENKEKPL